MNDYSVQQHSSIFDDIDIRSQAELFFILSDETRLKILVLLTQSSEVCVSSFAEFLGLTVSAISHQLRLLERSRLVTRKRDGKNVCYALVTKKDNALLHYVLDDLLKNTEK